MSTKWRLDIDGALLLRSLMSDSLRPATRDEICGVLGYGVRFGRAGRTHRHATEMMARILADVLFEDLELSGFVVMKRPPAVAHATPGQSD